jgi:radical SAM superfamily enzyme YgiQ (UPF0313 family)
MVSASPLQQNIEFMHRFKWIQNWAQYLIDHIGTATNIMRDKVDFYDIRKYQWAVTIINLACELASLPYYPLAISPTNIEFNVPVTTGNLNDLSQQISGLLYDTLTTPMKENFMLSPAVVGISITYKSQLIPGLTLAKWVKQLLPRAQIVIGGAFLSKLEKEIATMPAWAGYADSFVIGEGETALLRICERHLDKKQVEFIPNYFSPKGQESTKTCLGWLENVDELYCPDYEGIPLADYFSPEPVVLLAASRGCYHGKCAFCDVSGNTKSRHRAVKSGVLKQYIRKLHTELGAKRFFFCDDALPPAKLEEIVQLVKELGTDITWMGEARLERCFDSAWLKQLKAGGCCQLIFGLESACQRVLDLMNKQNQVNISRRIIQAAAAADIAVNVQSFIGFPTETEEEALLTINFLKTNTDSISSIGFTTFALFENTPVHKTPGVYGIQQINPDACSDVSKLLTYTVTSGMPSEEVNRLYKETLPELLRIYSARSKYLACAASAHSLLHFSCYGLANMKKIWQAIEAPATFELNSNDVSFEDARPQLSACVLLSEPYESSDGFKQSALMLDSGYVYDLEQEKAEILKLCNGRHTLAEIAQIRTAHLASPAEINEWVIQYTKSMVLLKELAALGIINLSAVPAGDAIHV